MTRFGLVASFLVGVTAGCTGEIVAPGTPDPGAGVTFSAGLHVPASEGANEVVVEPDSLRIYFDGEPPAYTAGEVVYGTEGPGYLRRIDSVEQDGHKVVLHTEQAALGDAFDQVQVDQVVAVVPSESSPRIAPTWRRQQVVIAGTTYTAEIRHDAPIAHPDARALTTSFVWEFPRLSITLTDPQGHLALELSADKLRIERTISLDMKVDFGFFKLKQLRFIDEEDTHASIEGLSVSATGSLPLAEASIPVFDAPALAVVPVGPLVFTVGASVELGADVSLATAAEIHTTSGVSYHAWHRQGVTWDGSFHVVDESTHEADTNFGRLDASVTPLQASASVFVTAGLRFALFGIVGPELFGRVTPLAADLTFGTDAVDGTLSASASAGARLKFPFFSLAGTSVTFASWSQQYGSFHHPY
jgi:hypothetical protein